MIPGLENFEEKKDIGKNMPMRKKHRPYYIKQQ
jgi:hypothetical protein